MAKRFTDTDKWRKPWFRALNSRAKMTWCYLLDNCDHAGIWPTAFDLISTDLGFKVGIEDLNLWFGDKLLHFTDKVFIPAFIEFQYGTLNQGNRAHQSVIFKLQKIGINKDLVSPLQGAKDKDKDKDMDKEMDKEQEGECEGETFIPDTIRLEARMKFDFGALFDLYPKPQKRTQAISLLSQKIRDNADYERWERAIKNYAKHTRDQATEYQYLMNFPNFVNEWEDWINFKAPPAPPPPRQQGRGRDEPRPITYPPFESVYVPQHDSKILDEERAKKAAELRAAISKIKTVAP